MSVALNVIIILGIVIAGGFLLFFLGDFLISAVEERKQKQGNVAHQNDEVKVNDKRYTSMVVTNYIPQPEPEKVEDKKEEETQVVDDEEEKRIAEARAALERRKQEILKRMQAQIEEDDEDEEEEKEEEPAEDEKTEETGVVSIAQPEEDEEEKVDVDALQAEIEQLKNQLGLEKEKYDALAKEMESQPVVTETVTVEGETLGSKEDYLAMLEEKQNRLKVVEKEFKQCKKDYLPLYRVNKTLAKDEKKLHRREAIVAKQKVVLYGVNNYADIDEEKAKKLAEDLDLLDGLKLSVNHCKEVMEENKDRYPILEKLYTTLKTQVEALKTEIEKINTILAKFEEEPAQEENA